MADANDDRIAALERRIAELEQFVRDYKGARIPNLIAELCVASTKTEKRVKLLGEVAEHQAIMVETLAESSREKNLDILRLYDAYYTVFPERRKQDAKFNEQLDALTAPKKNIDKK